MAVERPDMESERRARAALSAPEYGALAMMARAFLRERYGAFHGPLEMASDSSVIAVAFYEAGALKLAEEVA